MTQDSFSPFDLAPSSVTDIIKNPNGKIETLLKDEHTFRFFNTGDSRIVKYFCNHVKELLIYAFKQYEIKNPQSFDYEQLSSRAFAILEHSDPTLTESMLHNDQLRDIASSILWKKDPESVLLSRLSSLTLVAFLYSPMFAQVSCGYILQMLNYVSEPTVLSLFQIVCSSEDRNVLVQQWLLSLSFPDILFEEIEAIQQSLSISFNNSETLLHQFQLFQYSSDEANKYCGLLKIVHFCSESLILSESVRTQRFLELLHNNLGELPQFIEDARWQAISSMYSQNTCEFLRCFFNPAISILNDEHLSKTLSGISAIEFINTMAQNDQILRQFLSIAEVTKTIIMLMINNPDHSILQETARKYLYSVFHHPKTREAALTDSIPLILETAKKNSNKLNETKSSNKQTEQESNTNTQNQPEDKKVAESQDNEKPLKNNEDNDMHSKNESNEKCNVSLKASMYAVLNLAINLGKTDSKTLNLLKTIPGLFDFVQHELAEYNAKQMQFYGGIAPPPQTYEMKELANRSLDQMHWF